VHATYGDHNEKADSVAKLALSLLITRMTIRRSESAYIRQGRWVWRWTWVGRDMGCMREMADALWEGHTLLKNGLSAYRHTQTDRQK